MTDLGGRYRALTRYRDLDGRLRKVTAVAGTPRAAQARLKARLCELWLSDLGKSLESAGVLHDGNSRVPPGGAVIARWS